MTKCLLIFRSTLFIWYELLLNPSLEDWSYYHTKTWSINLTDFLILFPSVGWLGSFADLCEACLLSACLLRESIVTGQFGWGQAPRIASHVPWLASCLLGQWVSQSQWSPTRQKAWAYSHSGLAAIQGNELTPVRPHETFASSTGVKRSKKANLGSKSGKITHVPFLDRKTPNFPLQIWVITGKGLISTIFQAIYHFMLFNIYVAFYIFQNILKSTDYSLWSTQILKLFIWLISCRKCDMGYKTNISWHCVDLFFKSEFNFQHLSKKTQTLTRIWDWP